MILIRKAIDFESAKTALHLPWLVIVLALAHGCVDLASGWSAAYVMNDGFKSGFQLFDRQASAVIGLLLFNLLAFGLQPLFGLWVDRRQDLSRLSALVPTSLVIAAICMLGVGRDSTSGFVFTFILLPLASAAFHIGAGGLVLMSSKTPRMVGWWAAPGILGQGLGASAALLNLDAAWAMGLVLALLAFLTWQLQRRLAPTRGLIFSASSTQPIVASIAITAFVIMAFRSAAWLETGVAIDNHNLGLWMFLASVVAAVGKVLGGEMSARLNVRLWIVLALSGGLLFFALGVPSDKTFTLHWATFAMGVLLLQSTVPALWWMQAQSMPGRIGLATGLSLGLASVAGGLPLLLAPNFFGINSHWFNIYMLEDEIGLALMVALGLLYWRRSRGMSVGRCP